MQPQRCPDNPVENVSWRNSDLHQRVNQPPRQCTYRLPTEPEWEYAARAGTTTAHSFGAAPIVTTMRSQAKTQIQVPQKPNEYSGVAGGHHDNPWHLYDMHGMWGDCRCLW